MAYQSYVAHRIGDFRCFMQLRLKDILFEKMAAEAAE